MSDTVTKRKVKHSRITLLSLEEAFKAGWAAGYSRASDWGFIEPSLGSPDYEAREEARREYYRKIFLTGDTK